MTLNVSDSDALTLVEVRAKFLERFDALCVNGGLEPGPLSRRLFGASDRISEIRVGGSDIGIARMIRALEQLAALEAASLGGKGEAA